MRNLAILIALVFLTSCAQVPKEKAYRLSYQRKMQASVHWYKLARKVAVGVKKVQISEMKKIPKSEMKQVFMSDADNSPFGKAMTTFLATLLNQQGSAFVPSLVLTADKNCPYKLIIDVQKVYHSADRSNNGSWMWYALCYVPQSFFLGETDRNWRTKPHSEVIVTYELLKNEISLLRVSGIFYVNDADRDQYWESHQIELAATLEPVNHDYIMTNTY